MGTTRRTANLTLAAAIGLGTIAALAGATASAAGAETPEHTEEMVLVLPGDTDLQGPTDLAPAPTPEPEDDKAPVPHDDPEPEPQPDPDDDKAPVPHDDPEPEPEADLPIAQPEPECDPKLASFDLTDVPDEEDCNPILASCDLTSDPGDPGDPGDDDTPEPEVSDEVSERDALPRTGAGLVLLGTAGTALTGLGVALRRLARR